MNGAALRMAACYSDAAVVELLIEKGADMTQTNLGNDRFSGTPFARLWAEAGNRVQWRSPRDDDDDG